jgi:hypothetical protein
VGDLSIADQLRALGERGVLVTMAEQGLLTHVWFEAAPPVHLLLKERPLPKRYARRDLGGVDASRRAGACPDVERSGRVLMTAKGKQGREVAA